MLHLALGFLWCLSQGLQTLARHSSPSLTIGIYAKTSLHDIKGAVENLPDVTPKESTPVPLAMTGTDPVVTPISELFAHHLPTEGDVSGRDGSDFGVMTHSGTLTLTNEKPLNSQGLDASNRPVSSFVGNAPCRTRTYNPLIKSQLLCQLS